MENGSSSDFVERGEKKNKGKKLGSMMPQIEPFVPRTDHNPRELRSWAKRTGFVSNFSGETTSASASERFDSSGVGLERAGRVGGGGNVGGRGDNGGSSPKREIDPIIGWTRRNRGNGDEIESAVGTGNGGNNPGDNDGTLGFNQRRRIVDETSLRDKEDERKVGVNGNGNGTRSENGNGNGNIGVNAVEKRGEDANGNGNRGGGPMANLGTEPPKDEPKGEEDVGIGIYQDGGEQNHGWWAMPREMKLGLRDKLGVAPAIYFGLQHYLSLAGSLIFIPLVMVPTMGGSDKDTATVISTMLLVSGITTLLNSFFGARLPLVQGSSFVYLAPVLVITNSRDFRELSEHKFRRIMREVQGAIIIGSIFQSILGFTGIMSFILRFINPVLVAPTVAAVGLAYFSFGFPQAGSCVEISIPLIALVLIFSLYLRGISICGHRPFRIYAVPLSVMIIWAYAFFLTAGGAYNFKGCSPDIPSSNILIDECRRHAYTMKHCRTDVSNAMRTADWVRIPYPLQWGIPIFHPRTSMIMLVVSLVASLESVGIYYSSSLLVCSKPPTPGIVGRGIAVEGFCSILAGLWGSGTGSTTLTENVYTISITKVANRRAVEVGAIFLIFFSFIGKVGAILASIPQSLAASILCFEWALVVALGFLTLQYSQTASFRNMIIVGVSLFLGLSIPAYFQQYQPQSNLMVPGYLIPYAAASDGPVHSGSSQLNFAINGLMSLNMVVTLLTAFILDNTVPGSKQERGVYTWSRADDLASDPDLLADYSLPRRVSRICCRARCLGT